MDSDAVWLTNAPSVFQQQEAMHAVLHDLIEKICLVYLDDIIIIAKTAEEHARNLDLVLTRLHEHKFYCNFDKCQFCYDRNRVFGACRVSRYKHLRSESPHIDGGSHVPTT